MWMHKLCLFPLRCLEWCTRHVDCCRISSAVNIWFTNPLMVGTCKYLKNCHDEVCRLVYIEDRQVVYGFERPLRAVPNSFVWLFAQILSSRLSGACEISGFRLASVLARRSSPYFCFTRDGRSLCIRFSHVKVRAPHLPPVSHHGE